MLGEHLCRLERHSQNEEGQLRETVHRMATAGIECRSRYCQVNSSWARNAYRPRPAQSARSGIPGATVLIASRIGSRAIDFWRSPRCSGRDGRDPENSRPLPTVAPESPQRARSLPLHPTARLSATQGSSAATGCSRSTDCELSQWWRSACDGSSAAARRAGTHEASTATLPRATTVAV